jgi:hypothetical protein
LFIGTGYKVAFFIEVHAVGTPCAIYETDRFPSVSYFHILLLGWSVKKTFPFYQLPALPVKLNCLEINLGIAPVARIVYQSFAGNKIFGL